MRFNTLLLCGLLAITNTVQAADTAVAEQAHLSTQDILDILISEKVISQQRAEEILQSLAAKKSGQQITTQKKSLPEEETPLQPNVVRIPYVPTFVRDQIRDEVRVGLHDEVVNDVFTQARNELWGVPGAMPEWTTRLKFSGDFRLRYQGDFFADDNKLTGSTWYINANQINAAGAWGTGSKYYYNILEDRNRLRARLRFNMDAKVTEGVNVNMRLATGKFDDPVSTNQTMGVSSKPYPVILDRAYLKATTRYKELAFMGGRMANPWLGTDLIWDSDLNFEGVATTYHPLRSDSMDNDENMLDVFVTLGAFPISEVQLSAHDKWLYGLQTGVNWRFLNQDSFDFALAYYDYRNIEGERNTSLSNLNDYTAPDLLSTGNTLFNIANISLNSSATLLALASDYNLANLYLHYNIRRFAPINLDVSLDYVKNIGYKQSDVLARTGGSSGLLSVAENSDGTPHVKGYMVKFDLGWPQIKQRDSWQLSLAYRYLERDAVLDVFTDSDFRGGGTDNKGYIIQGQYALEENTWVSLKLISADQIDGPPFGLDTVQADLNVVF